MGPLCAGLVADMLAGLVNSQRACQCRGRILEGLAQRGPMLLGVGCGWLDSIALQLSCMIFQVALTWFKVHRITGTLKIPDPDSLDCNGMALNNIFKTEYVDVLWFIQKCQEVLTVSEHSQYGGIL